MHTVDEKEYLQQHSVKYTSAFLFCLICTGTNIFSLCLFTIATVYAHINVLISSNGKFSHLKILWQYVSKHLHIDCKSHLQFANFDKY